MAVFSAELKGQRSVRFQGDWCTLKKKCKIKHEGQELREVEKRGGRKRGNGWLVSKTPEEGVFGLGQGEKRH